VVCALVVATTCLPSAKSEPQEDTVRYLPLIPVFSAVQDEPEFVANLKNETQHPVDIVRLITASSIVLDGATYKRQVITFAGHSQLHPDSAIPFKLELSGYILGSVRREYSEPLKRWRWKSPLASGQHTLLLSLAGRHYGPVSFMWDGNVPLLTK